MGSQIGIPSYFMPGPEFNGLWHIGFAHWLEPATEVVKSLDRVQELRAEGKLEINEFPPPAVGFDNYLFASGHPPHVVNCPTPITVDAAVHRAVRGLAEGAGE